MDASLTLSSTITFQDVSLGGRPNRSSTTTTFVPRRTSLVHDASMPGVPDACKSLDPVTEETVAAMANLSPKAKLEVLATAQALVAATLSVPVDVPPPTVAKEEAPPTTAPVDVPPPTVAKEEAVGVVVAPVPPPQVQNEEDEEKQEQQHEEQQAVTPQG